MKFGLEGIRDLAIMCLLSVTFISPFFQSFFNSFLSLFHIFFQIFFILSRSHFLLFFSANTKLDQEAEHRATSVYLVQQVIPMLPRTLCENLCSLNPSLDRLTFSVQWVNVLFLFLN